MPDSKTCPECGALLAEGAEQCGLCGTPVPSSGASDAGAPAEASSAGASSADASPGPSPPLEATGASGVFCNECGWQNPTVANYCSRCGHKLQDAAGAPPEGRGPDTKPATGPPREGGGAADRGPEGNGSGDADATFPSAADDGMMRRVGIVVGMAVLLVAGLYGWSAWSGTQTTSAPAAGEEAPAAGGMTGSVPGGTGASGGEVGSGGVPAVVRQQTEQTGKDLPASIAARADSLQRVIDSQSGEQVQRARRELVKAYTGAGKVADAAAQQWLLVRSLDAADTGATAAWERAGSLLYDWMASLERGQKRAQVARLTVDAYQRVLEAEPQNHDVRTNLAVAYLDTNNPMRGISEIKRVLSEAPNHVGARFNYGLMQVMIGRNKTAVEQFERVRETAGEDSPYYQQAGKIIERINEQTGGNPQDPPTPGNAPATGPPGS